MRRREFGAFITGAAALGPLTARAQKAMRVIGLLSGTSPVGYAPFVAAFRQGLGEAGFVDGQNVTIEYRWAEGVFERLPAMAEVWSAAALT